MDLPSLLGVDQARRRIARRCPPLDDTATIPLAKALGRVLRRPLRADRALPPYNRSAMDGYAVQSRDFVYGKAQLVQVASIPAGTQWGGRLGKGQCAQIMTGAATPRGADAVVKVELTRRAGDVVHMLDTGIRPWHNIHRRGADARQGKVLLPAGRPMAQGDIGVAASIGARKLEVIRRIVVGVLSTGEEVVPVAASPTPFQIRDANGPTLMAILAGLPWCRALALGIAPDNERALCRRIDRALERCDVLLISGGVSVGEFDLVPQVLGELSVTKVFHGVAIRPGKPLWFGVGPRGTLVFGLPGNPVSVRVGFREFVTSALRRLAGFASSLPPTLTLPLGEPAKKRHGLTAFSLARVVATAEGSRVVPVAHEGSGDFVSAAGSDGVFVFPGEVAAMDAGEVVEFHPWEPA